MQAQANKKKSNTGGFASVWRKIVGSDEFSVAVPLFALMVLMGIIALINPQKAAWFDWSNFSSILTQFFYIGICSLAAAFPLMTGNVDISTGRLVGLSVMLTATAVGSWGMPTWVAAIVAILVTSIFGIINGILVVKLNVPDFVATMGTLYISGGCRYIMFKGYEMMMVNESTTASTQATLNFFSDQWRFLGLPRNFWIAFIIFAIAFIVMKKTVFGRRLLACGDNREVAALAGINVTKYRLIAYYICAFLCGVAGVLFAFNQQVGRPSTGDGWEFRAIAACVVGGTSLAGGKCSPLSVFIGCFLVMAVENAILFFPEFIPATMADAVRGIIMAAAVLWDMARQKKKVKA